MLLSAAQPTHRAVQRGFVALASQPSPAWLRRGKPSTAILVALLLASAALLLLLALGALSLPTGSDNAGGRGAALAPPRFRRSAFESRLEMRGEKGEPWTEVLSWEPRAFVYHNFLSKEECDYLISLAKPRMKKSTVHQLKGVKIAGYEQARECFLEEGRTKLSVQSRKG